MSGTNGHGPKKAILYARVSTEEQARSGYSLAQQMEALRGSTRPARGTRSSKRSSITARAGLPWSAQGWTV